MNKNENFSRSEHRIEILFFGKDKYKNREEFLRSSIKFTDERFIKVKHLNEYDMSCDILSHSFDNIILDYDVKNRIINGLTCWSKSKEWYEDHQLVHKMGVFLYGKPGTGKSTIAKSISAMFNNAPILTIDHSMIMKSIDGIFRMRKRYEGTLIILIEDFDMYFKNREEIEGIELDLNQKKTKDSNMNAVFQLLDGIYSTENTIYIATTNYRDRIDEALIRYGRFDIQEELEYFDRYKSEELVRYFGCDKDILNEMNLSYPVQPSLLQGKIMEYRANVMQKGFGFSTRNSSDWVSVIKAYPDNKEDVYVRDRTTMTEWVAYWDAINKNWETRYSQFKIFNSNNITDWKKT